MDSIDVPRWYHSTAMLLKDGRVISAGGNNVSIDLGDGDTNYYRNKHGNYQIFTPPYLMGEHANHRPIITSIQDLNGQITDTWSVGHQYYVYVTNTLGITKVALVRLGCVTHGFDQNQRYVPLTFTVTPTQNRLTVNAPPTLNHAPPGWYMLFVLRTHILGNDRQLVPSVAQYIKIQSQPD